MSFRKNKNLCKRDTDRSFFQSGKMKKSSMMKHRNERRMSLIQKIRTPVYDLINTVSRWRPI